MSVEVTAPAGNIKQTVQIALLKQSIDSEKQGVARLYDTLDSLTPVADAYIPTAKGPANGGLYTP